MLLQRCLLLLLAAHAHSHSEVTPHSVVEHHSFEFSVSKKTKNNRNDVESGQKTNYRELEGWRGVWICELSLQALGLDHQANNVNVSEEVDCDVHNIEG